MSDCGTLGSHEGSPESFTSSTCYAKSIATTHIGDEPRAEESKAALHYTPELLSYLTHFVSLLFTAVVLQLSFREVYWADEDGWRHSGWSLGLSQPVMAGLLQFAAKLHEVCILASLSAIAIDIIRRRLLVSRGVPFGFVMGGYRFGSASSIFSGSFWGPFTDAIRHGRFELLGLGLLLGLGAIYANAIGPASAVLMVPTLNWWPAYDLTALMVGNGPFYPTSITADNWMIASCLRQSEDLPFGCPGLGASDLQNADYYTTPEDLANRSLTQRYGRARRNLYTSSAISPSWNSTLHISSTIHSVVMEAIGLVGRFVSTFPDMNSSISRVGRPQLEATNSAGVMSPVVQTECASARLNGILDGTDTLLFPTSILSRMNVTSQIWPVPEEYWPFADKPPLDGYLEPNFTWVDRAIFQLSDQTSASIGAIVAIPFDHPRTQVNFNNYGHDDVFLVACVLDARWAATDISYDPGTSDTVVSNLTDMSLFTGAAADTDLRFRYGISDSIYIPTDWADLLNAPVAPPGYEGIWSSAIQNYLKRFMTGRPDGNQNAISDISKFLSLTLVDGLSRSGTENMTFWVMNRNSLIFDWTFSDLSGSGDFEFPSETVTQAGTTVTFKVQRYGWGYGNNSKTARFAISILLIHAVFAVVYMIFTIAHWFIYRWSSRSWKNMEQLFALAMVSTQPPSLRGVSAGVGTWDTWKIDVAIREGQEEGQDLNDRIELVFGERDGGPIGRRERQIRRRKRYQ
ncbi:hypothetical protein PFICI_02633 [Pestalotiopsis fici W106-1]|uniref:Uncharacterized protein n=1 Tax=Pestalotiopsis fici (strain W106-1 / CGMCC3.15140) TaxID=1229662 RepID=W3XET1_PESFW|nr:uncharacterized protein PFICI_02633 [Pestalotiopsis fici W106-1]ETS84608.1 hypothetical protein PFICI_02633 [Pestalotiopsis fici W106-1]